jgi:hypothetical protein
MDDLGHFERTPGRPFAISLSPLLTINNTQHNNYMRKLITIGCALIAQIAYAQTTMTPYGTTTTATTPYGKIIVTMPKATVEHARLTARRIQAAKDAQDAQDKKYEQAKRDEERAEQARLEYERREREYAPIRQAQENEEAKQILQLLVALAPTKEDIHHRETVNALKGISRAIRKDNTGNTSLAQQIILDGFNNE